MEFEKERDSDKYVGGGISGWNLKGEREKYSDESAADVKTVLELV